MVVPEAISETSFVESGISMAHFHNDGLWLTVRRVIPSPVDHISFNQKYDMSGLTSSGRHEDLLSLQWYSRCALIQNGVLSEDVSARRKKNNKVLTLGR
jgi:hypothetical protein